jgi:carbonic anhydrase/acetyltransferase-like protein (isoleucine patch superfamily)
VIRRFRDSEPGVDSSAFVDQSAQVIGDVVIGAESSIWMNVVIRGDVHHIRIGRRTNIQDLTMVHVMRDAHPTIIGDEVTIGHSAVVHGVTIEDRVLVGMAAVLLNGVHIGHDSVVAAGTLLTEGTHIPPRSLVMGRPGKVKRTLTDEEVAGIRRYADNYVAYRLEYMHESASLHRADADAGGRRVSDRGEGTT